MALSSTVAIRNSSIEPIFDVEEMEIEHLRDFELENRMRTILIPVEEARKWSLQKVVGKVFMSLFIEGKERPLSTIAKTTISLAGLSAIYPAAVGSWACIKTLQMIPVSDLESTDRATAALAAQGIGNAGMAITYMFHLREFVFHPISRLFITRYNKLVCKEIRDVYSKVLLKNRVRMSSEEIDFLIQRENRDLSCFNGLAISDTININVIQSDIKSKLKKRLTMKNISCLTAQQIKKDIINSSWVETLEKISQITLLVGLMGVASSILIVGTYGCYKPFALQNPVELKSFDPEQVFEATANFANAGHGLEYVAVIAVLGCTAIRLIAGDLYNKVICQEIRNVYRHYIEDRSQPRAISDLLHRHMKQEFSHYLGKAIAKF